MAVIEIMEIRWNISILGFLLLVLIASCEKDNPSEDEQVNKDDFDRQGLLTDLSDQIRTSFANFDAEVEDLESSLNVFSGDVNQSNLDALRLSWSNALISWQFVAPYQFALTSDLILEETSNTYPTNIDQINENIQNGGYNLDAPVNLDATGFPAMDYLLFGIGDTDQEIIDLFTVDALAQSRINYLQDIVDQLSTKIDLITSYWAEGSNNISDFVANDGKDNGSSLSKFLNAWIQSYEKKTRTNKLGTPAGALTFSMIPQPNTVEAYYENFQSVIYLKNSVQASKEIFQGTNPDGISFADYIQDLNATHNGEALEQVILDQFDEIENSLDNLQDPLSDFVVNEQSTALDTYAELQNLVVLLKVDMMSAFGIEVTYIDSDGD